MSRYVLLSFDVEEFDMPCEYNHAISAEEQLEIGKRGLDALMPVISTHALASTLFITANYARQFSKTVKELATHHEIASHTFYHSSFENKDLIASRQVLEEISGKSVTGLRMPRMRMIDMDAIKNAGYIYDSSINPTLLPGRYNNLSLPRTMYKEKGIVRIPASVSPNLRLPLFWLGFKNYPYALFRHLCLQCIRRDGYVCLYFHPWEFTDIKDYNLPWFAKRYCGKPMLEKLHTMIMDLKKDCDFITMQDFIERTTSKKDSPHFINTGNL